MNFRPLLKKYLRSLARRQEILLAAPSCRHLKDCFQLNRGTTRKACNAIHQAARVLVFSENVLQQLRSGVSDFRLTGTRAGGSSVGFSHLSAARVCSSS